MIDSDALLSFLERSHSLVHKADTADETSQAPTDRQKSTTELIDRRRDVRYPTSCNVSVVPILPDFSLDLTERFTGKMIDISDSGIGVQLESIPGTVTRTLLLRIEVADGRRQYAAIDVCRIDSIAPDVKRIGGRFGGAVGQLLQSPILTPIFDRERMQYRFPFPDGALRDWVEAGALKPRLLDRVLVCPRCETLPTFRNACRACKSARIDRERLIHHYACAHIDRLEAFSQGGELVCPKCLRRNLVVGADFDFQQGPVICADCRWHDSEPAQIGHCLRCGFRFLAEQAKEQQLVGYDAQRLDILAFLPAS